MIELHLLRHAHAGNPDRWMDDDALRPLSDKGRRQSERLGALLAAGGDAPDLFITSPRVRAAQTAELVAAAVGARVVVDERLGGMLDLDTVAAVLHDAGPAERPCLVGHDPAFSELLAELVGVPDLPMRKGAIARLGLDGPRPEPGRAILRYLVPPDLLGGS
jgi:phosphohistidine phosphatase